MWFILLLSVACAKYVNAFNFTMNLNVTVNLTYEYQYSLNTWNIFKDGFEDCYTYASISLSGPASVTIIDVEDGMVEERSYYAFDNNGSITDFYEETEPSQIGTHSAGADPNTIDEIYQECANYLSLNTTDNYIMLQTDHYGLLQLCGYVPKLCVDDCFQGISISSIDFCSDTDAYNETTEAPWTEQPTNTGDSGESIEATDSTWTGESTNTGYGSESAEVSYTEANLLILMKKTEPDPTGITDATQPEATQPDPNGNNSGSSMISMFYTIIIIVFISLI